MKAFCAAAVTALLIAPAYAQQQEQVQQAGQEPAAKSQQQIESDREAQRAYKKSLGNIPDRGPADPWGTVRSESPPKTVAKAPTKRTKTGGAAD